MMSEELKKILFKNAQEYYTDAVNTEKSGNYNSSVTLFFKSLASLSDFYILLKEGFTPSNHSERFRILESRYLEIYEMNDEVFSFYQDSYKIKLDKEICEVIRKNVERLFDIVKTIM